MSLIGKRVLFSWGDEKDRKESGGIIIDKVRINSPIQDDQGNVIQMAQHDSYVVIEDDFKITNVHPLNLIKFEEDEIPN